MDTNILSPYPSFEDYATQAARSPVVPVYCELMADTLTPLQALAACGASKASYLLESVVGGEQWGRYSFVGLEPDMLVRGRGDRFELLHADGQLDARDSIDPWDALRELMKSLRSPTSASLPRFWGGAVGYVSYDAARRFEPSIAAPLNDIDDDEFAFAVGGPLLIFDNLKQRLSIVIPTYPQRSGELKAHYDRAVASMQILLKRLHAAPHLPFLNTHALSEPYAQSLVSSMTRTQFHQAVERAKAYIRAGDIFQVVLSQRFCFPAQDYDLLSVYRAMRMINPSPYMYVLNFPECRIVGASPETLVRVEDGKAYLRPIAGTRKRGANPDEDQHIAQDLLKDPKEIAEHVMLVDLGRNDLGRIAKTGTVNLRERMSIERYSHVMHIVSDICGDLADHADALDVLRATFPAGTLSGAPKVRAMQIIDELEPVRRGVYGGAVGYLGFDGNMDVAISIRTLVQRRQELLLQAGAGIVEASDPEYEYQETINKAKAALSALQLAIQS